VIAVDAAASTLATGVLLGGMLALAALGLSLVLGVLRLVNLAHGELLLLGAYGGFFLLALTAIDPLLALPLIALATALLAAPLYRYLLQPLMGRGAEAPMMTTFGVSVALQNLFLLFFQADTRSIETRYSSAALSLGPVTVPWIYVAGFAIAALISALLHWLVARSAFGRDLRASAEDPRTAAVMGVPVARVRLLTFMLGAGCAGAGGTLMALAFSFTPASGAAYLLDSFAVVILGGLGNVLGTFVAGIVLGVLQAAGALVLGDGYRDLVALALFLIVLAVRPQGLLAVRA
jgi:branched-chain amino acid transport system permease protein